MATPAPSPDLVIFVRVMLWSRQWFPHHWWWLAYNTNQKADCWDGCITVTSHRDLLGSNIEKLSYLTYSVYLCLNYIPCIVVEFIVFCLLYISAVLFLFFFSPKWMSMCASLGFRHPWCLLRMIRLGRYLLVGVSSPSYLLNMKAFFSCCLIVPF